MTERTETADGRVHLFDPAMARKLGTVDAAACGATAVYTMSHHEIGRGRINCPDCLLAYADQCKEAST